MCVENQQHKLELYGKKMYNLNANINTCNAYNLTDTR